MSRSSSNSSSADISLPLLNNSSDSNSDYQSTMDSSQSITLNEEKTQIDQNDESIKQPLNMVQEEHKYPNMHRYLTENKLEFHYNEILKHNEDGTDLLKHLSDIFEQEIRQENKEQTSRCSQIKRLYHPWMKWSWVDQLAEKILQSLVILATDLHPETKEKCKPVWKEERSILLSTVQGLEKANFVRGFVQGIE